MRLLALETSSEEGSVALADGADAEQRGIATPREQTEQVLPLVQGLLRDAGLSLRELDGIAFGCGPGSFTGLRVAAAVAQGLGLAADLPLLPVSSLAAMAQGAWRTHELTRSLVCVDARMGEVFWGAFEIREGLAEPLVPERLSEPGALAWEGGGEWGAVGGGFQAYEDLLAPLKSQATIVLGSLGPKAADLLPRARAELLAGRGQSPESATPVYLRGENAWHTNPPRRN